MDHRDGLAIPRWIWVAGVRAAGVPRTTAPLALPVSHRYKAATVSRLQRNIWNCEGFRMPAHRDSEADTGAGVRKPPGKEPASHGARGCRKRYGDFGVTGWAPD
jgi:hypothetical protein